MGNFFRNLIEWLSFGPSFEDMLYANFKAKGERRITVVPQVPLIPPFKSKEIDVYSNKDNYRFINALGEDSLFIRSLMHSLRLAYSKPLQEKSVNKFYIFTDNEERFDCPPSFFVIPTKKQELYQKISELRKQIMPEEPLPYTFYSQQGSISTPLTCYTDSYKTPQKTKRKYRLASFLLWLHEKIR